MMGMYERQQHRADLPVSLCKQLDIKWLMVIMQRDGATIHYLKEFHRRRSIIDVRECQNNFQKHIPR